MNVVTESKSFWKSGEASSARGGGGRGEDSVEFKAANFDKKRKRKEVWWQRRRKATYWWFRECPRSPAVEWGWIWAGVLPDLAAQENRRKKHFVKEFFGTQCSGSVWWEILKEKKLPFDVVAEWGIEKCGIDANGRRSIYPELPSSWATPANDKHCDSIEKSYSDENPSKAKLFKSFVKIFKTDLQYPTRRWIPSVFSYKK